MTQHIEHVERIAISDLRPTQSTVGYREVIAKRAGWDALTKAKRRNFLDGHVVPTVVGPKERPYIVDHHHLARALADDGHATILIGRLANLSALDKDEFWIVMEHRRWVYPYDAEGRRQAFADIPKMVTALPDNPWRSLAGALRAAGGFAKEDQPFAEFLWADFLRRRIDPKILQDDFAAATAAALKLCHTKVAAHLPGWSATRRG